MGAGECTLTYEQPEEWSWLPEAAFASPQLGPLELCPWGPTQHRSVRGQRKPAYLHLELTLASDTPPGGTPLQGLGCPTMGQHPPLTDQ